MENKNSTVKFFLPVKDFLAFGYDLKPNTYLYIKDILPFRHKILGKITECKKESLSVRKFGEFHSFDVDIDDCFILVTANIDYTTIKIA